jgi:DNA-binding beta-propeller fold protein YncE
MRDVGRDGRVFGVSEVRDSPVGAAGRSFIGLVVAAAALAVLAVVLPGATWAAVGHPYVSSVTEAPLGRALQEPGAVAVDRATGDVFVADPASGVVDVFDADGKYLTRFGADLEAASIAVDEASGIVYVAEPFEGMVLAFKQDGSGGYVLGSRWTGANAPGGSFGNGEVLGVAVDNSTSVSDPSAGDVYVVDGEGPAVNKAETQFAAAEVFKPGSSGEEGDFVRDLAGKGLREPNGVAVSAATGRVYVADSARGVVEAFDSDGVYEAKLQGSGSPVGSLEAGGVSAIAVDEATGGLLVAQEKLGVVDELDRAGEGVGWIAGTPSGPFAAVRGVAAAGSGGVYVADAGSGVVDVFGPGVTVPDVSAKAPSHVTGTSATLRGVIDGDGETASYHFELGESEAYGGLSTATMQTAGSGEERVQANVTGLKPASTYYFRLVGEEENGISCSVGLTFTTEGGQGGGVQAKSVSCARPHATIESTSAVEVGASEATLQAQVNPHGHDTSGYFQYGTESCATSPSSCTEVPQPPVEVGSGEADVAVSAVLRELKPDTTYHYRVLAANALGVSEGAERTFTTRALSVPSLPDGRAWEMVSPPNKHGGAISALTREGGWILAAEDGDALAYVANGTIEEEVQGNRSFEPQQVLATRGADGWSSKDIATPQERAGGANFGAPEYQFFSPDLSLALVQPYVAEPSLAPGVAGKMVYLRDDQPIAPEAAERQSYLEAEANSGFFQPGFLALVSRANAPEASFPVSVSFLGATPDLDHVVLEASAALAGPSSGVGLYEWSQGGALRFVSALPDGEPVSAVALGYYQVRAHAISNDGTRVIWTASQETPAHLYMRDIATEKTIQLDKGQLGSEPAGAARFQTASSDGSRVFFTDDQALVEGASVEPARETPDLYECEMIETGGELSCALRDLTIPLRKGEHAAVQGSLLGASEDGMSVYVVAKGVLAANENAGGERAQPGQDNLYELRYDGAGWTRTFIAVLSGEDAADWDAGPNVSDENTAFQTARVSPNGEYLAFMSQRSLTGYDNEDISSEHPGERLDQEVYLYDSKTERLTCVSCDPSGARPVGVLDQEHSAEGIGLVVDRRQSWRGHWLAGSIPGWTSQSLTNALYQSRYLSDEGRLFFDSADPLVPGIAAPTRQEEVSAGKTQRVGVENAYEYEPVGLGSCTSGSTGGCVSLISSGTSQRESAFLEATPNGNDVFFLTAAQLSSQDTDDAFDIYDARVCTSESPCLTPPPGSAASCASIEECHPTSSSSGQAAIGASGSAAFSGAGNLVPAPPKQEVRALRASSKPLTRAQKLTKALQACRKQHPRAKKKRQACEAHAMKLYGPKPKARKK